MTKPTYFAYWSVRVIAPLLFGVMALVACREPSLGLETQNAGDAANLIRVDTFSLEVAQDREDSVRSDELSANLLGAINDPLIGRSRASMYFQVRPGNSNITLGANPIVDSAVLVLPYRGFYGDITKFNGLQRFRVHRVTEAMSREASYFSNDSLTYESTPLGQTGFIAPLLSDSVPVTGRREAPQLRIKLNDSFAQEFVSNPDALLSVDAFTTFLKGFYVAAETRDLNDDRGAILDFILTSGARLDVFYKNDTQDSLRVTFPVNEQSARFNRFRHQYKQSVIDAVGSFEAGKNGVLIQNMGGLRAKLRIPHLLSWRGNRRILVHKARLVVSVPESSLTKYAPHPQLSIVLKDQAGNLVISPDLAVDNVAYSGGTYSASSKTYAFNITRYVQARLNDIITNEDFFIQPSATAVSAFRVALNGTQSADRPVKLEILYQELPQ